MSLAVLSTSCAPKNSTNSSKGAIASKYFSMRQQTEMLYVGLIQLSKPALLANAQTENGKAIIDEKLKAEIIAEQEEVLEKLKNIFVCKVKIYPKKPIH